MINEFKIRCSAIGQIMTTARSGDGLSETAKNYCQNYLKEQIYSKKKEFSNKFTEKGISVENSAIDYISDIRNVFYTKNESSFENSFMTGTPDIIYKDSVIDIKSSWDCFTFPIFEVRLNSSYWWQIQGYMHLCDKRYGEVVYVLMDTDSDEVEDVYSDIDALYRVKSFKVYYDEKAIEEIEGRVVACRDYINYLMGAI